MPKDRTENIDRYKVRGGHLNEYEYQQNEGALEESREGFGGEDGEGLRGAAEPNAPQNVAERIRQVEEAAHEKVARRSAKRGEGSALKKGAAGGAKKGAAKKGSRAKK